MFKIYKKLKRYSNKFYFILVLGIFAFVLPPITSELAKVKEPFDFSGILGFNPSKLGSSAPKTSGYYNLTGSNIIVDDADPLYNWSKTAAENPWCSGTGTFEDPYIIENVYIDGNNGIAQTPGKQHSGNCLSIYRSTAYFIVRGCFFTRAGSDEFNQGIYLAYTENGIIYNNTLSYSSTNLHVNDYSHNTTVLYNTFYHNSTEYGFFGRAVLVGTYSDDALITKNYFMNPGTGIQVANSKRSEIRQNLLNSTIFGFPIRVGVNLIYINDSKVVYNVFAGDYSGVNFEVSQTASSGNTIENNTISGTIPDLGTPTPKTSGDYEELIKLTESNFNTISHNVAFIPGLVSSAPEIPSYNVFVVLGVIGLISMLLLTREIRRRKIHIQN